MAVTSGPSISTSNDDEADFDKSDHVVRLLNTDTKKEERSFSFPNGNVSDISLSPDSSRIAIQTLGSTGIYSVSTGEIEFTIPYPVNEFIWSTNSDFVFITRSNGLFTGSVDSKEAKTIVSYNDVRPTDISFIEGSVIYFTGYTGTIDNAKNPDSYRVDTSKNRSDTETAALRKFPYQGQGFYVDYLNNVVTIQTIK
jgi:hypothetical protein